MKKIKFLLRIVSIVLVALFLTQGVFGAKDKSTQTNKKQPHYSVASTGEVPEEYKSLIQGDILINEEQLTKDYWLETEGKDDKVTVRKYALDGEKLLETSYEQRGAGIYKTKLLSYKHFQTFLRCSEDTGNIYSWSRLMRFIGVIGFTSITGNKLVKISPDGDVLWEKDFGFNKMIYNVIEKENGDIIVCIAKPTKLFSGMSDYSYKCYLILLSSDGELKKEVKLEKNITLFVVLDLNDDGFFAKTTVTDKDGEYKNYLCAYDHKFNLLWKQEKTNIDISYVCDDMMKNGYPLVTKINDDSSGKYRSTFISRIGFDGKVLSEHEWRSDSVDEYVSCEYVLSNGDYVFEFDESKTGNDIDRNVRFVRYSSDFECLGEIELAGYSIRRIIEANDCIIYCTFSARTYDENGRVEDRECVYTAFDYDYNLLWQKAVSE